MFNLRIALLLVLSALCGTTNGQSEPTPAEVDGAAAAATQSAAASPRRSQSRLVRMLTGRNETVRLNAVFRLRNNREARLRSVEDLLTAVAIQAEALRSQEIPPSLAELAYLLGTIDRPEVEAALVTLLDSENADLAMLAADVLGRNQFYGAIDDLALQTQRDEYDERYAFRFNLVRSLAQMKHPDAIEVLSRLQSRLRGQLRYELDRVLAEVTVDDFGGDQDRYQRWKEGERGSGIFQAAGFESSQKGPGYDRIRFSQPKYYGIDIRAQRVMFVLDHSGSMKAPTSSGSRLERAKRELIRVIGELPEEAEFSIVTFDSVVRHWRDNLVPATEENKRAAILHVRRLDYGSDTNTYGALRRALDFDPALEAVFLLTDGKPTSGEIVQPARIARDIIHRNRWRHLNINTIGISVGGPTESFLRSLASNSNGEFRAEH